MDLKWLILECILVGLLAALTIGVVCWLIYRQNFVSESKSLDTSSTELSVWAPETWTPKIWTAPKSTARYTLTTINVDGVERSYYVSRPLIQSKLVPVVIYFHGTTNGRVSAIPTFDEIGDQCVLVQPIGTRNADNNASWNDGNSNAACGAKSDDLGFVRELLTQIKSWTEADMDQVVVCGFSVGAAFVSYMSLQSDLREQIRGFGSMSSPIQQSDLTTLERADTTPTAVWLSVGASDPIVPWQGGVSPSMPDCATFASIQEVITTWATLAGIELTTTEKNEYTITRGNANDHGLMSVVFQHTGHTTHSDTITSYLNNELNGTSSLELACVSFLLGSSRIEV